MHPLFRSLAVAAALLATSAAAAFAGEPQARIEGPAADGVTYTVRVQSVDATTSLMPWGYAEGVVDGKRKSMLLRIDPTGEVGVYQFARVWPEEGRWMLRVSLGHPPAPATVASVNADGAIKSNKLHWKTDGNKECHKALVPYVKTDKSAKGGKSDDDC